MKKEILIFTCLFSLFANAEEIKAPSDPFDLSESASKIKELGIVTKSEVDKLELRAQELFKAENCKEAVKTLAEYARKANWLANMISANLDPYYTARYDDRKKYDFNKLKPLIPLESMSNDYKRKRDRAFVMQGECYLKMGNKEEALPLLLKALDLLNLEEDEWWERARKNLLTIIEVNV